MRNNHILGPALLEFVKRSIQQMCDTCKHSCDTGVLPQSTATSSTQLITVAPGAGNGSRRATLSAFSGSLLSSSRTSRKRKPLQQLDRADEMMSPPALLPEAAASRLRKSGMRDRQQRGAKSRVHAAASENSDDEYEACVLESGVAFLPPPRRKGRRGGTAVPLNTGEQHRRNSRHTAQQLHAFATK
jgi:hypothetical protein